MRGYINHDLEIKKLTDGASKHKLDINKDVLDEPKRLDFIGVPGLTMRKLADDPVIDIYTRIINYSKKDVARFKELLESCIRDTIGSSSVEALKGAPVIVLHPTMNDKVYVYTNLIMDFYDAEPFYWGRPRLTRQGATFIKGYYEDKADPKRAQAWSTIARAKSKLLRRELVDIPRALTRYMPELTKNYSSAQIRDIATSLVEYNAPTVLSYADTDPTDFYKMYAGGPDSCMKDNGSRPFSWMAKLKKPIHPTSVFAYSPYVKGVYMVKAGKVVARTFVYDMSMFSVNKENKWAYGRVYGATEKYTSIFVAALIKEGYGPLDNFRTNFGATYTIKLPPITVTEEEADIVGQSAGKYMYVPYLDNHSRSARVEYDEDADMLSVTFNSAKGDNCNMGSQHGFLPINAFMQLNCHACGGAIDQTRQQALFATDNAAFHSAECAIAAGYVQVHIGAGGANAWFRSDNPTITFDPISKKYYSPSGRTVYGVFPVISSLHEDPEDIDIYTSSGVLVSVGNEFFRMSMPLFGTIKSSMKKQKMHTAYGEYYEISEEALLKSYIAVKTVKTVILEDEHRHIDARNLREIECVAA